MGNVFRILKRDTLRMLKAPAALIVAAALLVLPSCYTWYNVLAFWDPYNSTGDLTVCVVNEDEGTQNKLTGPLNVGDLLEEELLGMDRLHFVAADHDQAMEDLRAGRAYAVYVVPRNFTESLVSPISGTIETPHIQYYTNEKLGPVTPKITDSASSTLEETINSLFVAKVSEVAVGAIDSAAGDISENAAVARLKSAASFDKAASAVDEAESKLAELNDTVGGAQDKVTTARSALEGTLTIVNDAKTVLADTTSEANAVQTGLDEASGDLVGSLSGVSAEVLDITERASTAADALASAAGSAQVKVDLACGRIQPLVATLNDIGDRLQRVADSLPADSALKEPIAKAAGNVKGHATELQAVLDGAQALSGRISESAQAAANASLSLNDSAQHLADDLRNYSGNLYGSAAPAITESLAQVNVACAHLGTALSDLEATTTQAQAELDQLNGVLSTTRDAAGHTGTLLGDVRRDVETVASDFNLLSKANAFAGLEELGNLNAESIGAFMGSPTELETVELYRPNAYGSAMAPLFMNLTFWIGAFMLVLIFRLEVDDEGVKKLALWQRYLSRFLFLGGMAILQALICCAGVLALGVQAANIPALFLAAACTSLAFFSIIYALSVNLRHIGMALCIVLVFAQIPGGSGLYPLELTGKFFQVIYPFLPFSYGIGALREAIFGFYGNYYAHNLAMLGVMFASALAIGMALVPLMTNVTHMAARQIREGGLYNGEDALAPVRFSRLTQMVDALTDHTEYRKQLEHSYVVFSKRYPVFMRVAITAGLVVPAVLAMMLALDAGEKAILLTVVLVWLVATLVFVLAVESRRYILERQLGIIEVAPAADGADEKPDEAPASDESKEVRHA